MWVSNVLVEGLLLFFGIIIRVFNLSGFIAGYNTASPAKKAKYNEKALTRFVGLLLISTGGILLIGGIFILLNIASEFVMAASWALFFAIMIFGLFYVNLSPRFKAKNKKEDEKTKAS
jgi:hypothetical protein